MNSKACVHLYCGEGKGKTTAAIGLAVRFAGRGGKVVLAQFLKDGTSGECRALAKLETITMLAANPVRKFSFQMTDDEKKHMKRDRLEEILLEKAHKKYDEKVELFGPEMFKEVERSVLLRNVDTAWMEHIDAMDDLKGSVGMQAYAQRDPIDEYRVVGGEMFDSMVAEIREKTVRTVLSVVPRQKEEVKRVQVANPLMEGTDENVKPIK